MRSGIANSDILKSYLGLLCLGKNDFDAIEGQRKDTLFARALHLRAVPSSPTLRQRLDTQAPDWFELAERINAAVLGMRIEGKPADFGALHCEYVSLDLDTFAMDNSGTAKEHMGRTYAGVDGHCPLVCYLGTQGYCLELALRPGTQHSPCETEYNFERVLPLVARLTPEPLLTRADSGFESTKLMCAMDQQAKALERKMAFIFKWTHAAHRWRRSPGPRWPMPIPGGRCCARASANVSGARRFKSSTSVMSWLRGGCTA